VTKAQRRKEQNRAAQKAFRERREAKVRDLEQKVAELEAKSFGASVENENLRNILKRLQEENVALKQASFTFSMPVNGQPSNGQQTPTQATSVNGTTTNGQAAPGIDWSQFAAFSRKPPSPPQSVSNDSLRSINDPSPQAVHRNSSASGASPESLFSLGPSPDSRMPSLFSANGNTPSNTAAQTAFQEALKRQNSSVSPNDQLSTPSSIGGTNKDDVEALFRSFYPNGIDNMLANISTSTGISSSTNNLPSMQNQMPQYTFLTQTPGLTSQADTSSNAFAKLFGDATSYRDSANNDATATNQSANVSNAANNTNNFSSLANQTQWSDLTDNSVNDFLNSLAGGNKSVDAADLTGGADDEAFSRQLEALIAQSGGVSPESAFNLAPNNAFSPTNYLNMSPSPLRSLSNSQSPRSGTDATSPQSDIKSPSSLGNGAMCESGVIHVLNDDGRVMRPSEVWTRMGMHDSDPQDLMIDDLCDQMKEKATCKDGKRYMKYDDVEGMMRRRAEGCDDEKPAAQPEPSAAPAPTKLDPSLDPNLVCSKDEHGEFDPIACQAKLNEAFLKQNGLAI
jgi:AP-1-like factor